MLFHNKIYLNITMKKEIIIALALGVSLLNNKKKRELEILSKYENLSEDDINNFDENEFINYMNYEIMRGWNRIPKYRKTWYKIIGLNESNWDNPNNSKKFNEIIEKSWYDMRGTADQLNLIALGYNSNTWDNYELKNIGTDAEPYYQIVKKSTN